MKIYKHIIIDVNNLFYRFYSVEKSKNSKLKLFNLKENNIYFKTLISILKHIERIESQYLTDNGYMYFLFDNPTSRDNIRKEIDENYKKDRVKMENDFYDTLNLLLYILKNHSDNYYTFQVSFLEADDLVKPLLNNYIKDTLNKILVYSEDMDYSRWITDNVFWYDSKTIYNKENFKAKYLFTPSEGNVTIYKCLTGDKIDKVAKGIKNISLDVIHRIVEENYNDIEDLLTNIHFLKYLTKEQIDKFVSNSNKLRTNYELIRSLDCDWEDIKTYLVNCRINVPILKKVYEQLVGNNIKEIDSRDIFEERVEGKNALF